MIEKNREAELKEFKLDKLREMIENKLKSSTGNCEMKNRPIIDKKIMWEINTGYLELIDENEMFGTVDLSNLTGHFLVYNSKETK